MVNIRTKITILSISSNCISFAANTLFLKEFGTTTEVELILRCAAVPLAVSGMVSGFLIFALPVTFCQIQSSEQAKIIIKLTKKMAQIFGVAVVLFLFLYRASGVLTGAILLCYILLSLVYMVSSVANAAAQSQGKYITSAIISISNSLGLFVGVAVAKSFDSALLIVAGQISGALIGLGALLKSINIKHTKDPISLSTKIALKKLRANAFLIIIAAFGFTAYQIVDSAISLLLPEGALVYMSWGQKLIASANTVLGFGILTVGARKARDRFSIGGEKSLLASVNHESGLTLFFGLCMWFGFKLCGYKVTQKIFLSHRFTESDVTVLYDYSNWMFLALGPLTAVSHHYQVYYTLGDYKKPAMLGVFAVLFYSFVILYNFKKYQMMAPAFGFAISWWTTMAVSMIFLNIRRVFK